MCFRWIWGEGSQIVVYRVFGISILGLLFVYFTFYCNDEVKSIPPTLMLCGVQALHLRRFVAEAKWRWEVHTHVPDDNDNYTIVLKYDQLAANAVPNPAPTIAGRTPAVGSVSHRFIL